MSAWYREHLYDWDKDTMYWTSWKELPEGKHGFSHQIEISFESPPEPMEEGIYAVNSPEGDAYLLYKKEEGEWTWLNELVWEKAYIAEGEDKADLHRIGPVPN